MYNESGFRRMSEWHARALHKTLLFYTYLTRISI